MAGTTSKVLAVLELLQAHGHLSGAAIARRIGVDVRTVRRYVATLEEMGIPITAELGRDGGYGLVAGFRLPPMLFDDDETLALALGLVAAGGLGLGRAAPGLASARAKLERVMPERLRKRLRSAAETTRIDLPAAPPSGGTDAAASVDPDLLARLAEATRDERAVELDYRAADGGATRRRFDSYGLAFRGGAWYAAGHCHLRGGLRHFRVDRIVALRALDVAFRRPAEFDVVAELTRAIATLPRAHSAEIVLDADLATAKRSLFAAFGRLEPLAPASRGTLLFVETEALDWVARELARLPFSFTVRRPRALRDALRRHARKLLADAARTDGPPRTSTAKRPR